MPDADLDVVIRKLAKQQHVVLMAAVKKRRAHFTALAAKAKTAEAKQHLKHLATDATLHGTAAAKRLQMSADNAADSYARAMRKAAEAKSEGKPDSKPAATPTSKKPSSKKAPAGKTPAGKAPAKPATAQTRGKPQKS